MEPIPKDWDWKTKVKTEKVNGFVRFLRKEIYSKDDFKIIVLNQSDLLCTRCYYYHKKNLIACYKSHHWKDSKLIIGSLNRKYNYSFSYPNIRLLEKIPPIWKNPESFEQISKMPLFKNHYLEITHNEVHFKDHFNFNQKILLGFNWKTMKLYHLTDIFYTFTKNSCLVVNQDDVYHLINKFLIYNEEIDWYSDWELIKITRKLFLEMDLLYTLIETTLPQPIFEEILPNLINPEMNQKL